MSNFPLGKNIPVTVVSAEVGESKEKGTPGVFFVFRNHEGQEIDAALWLTETVGRDGKTPLKRTVHTLRECFGFDDDFSRLGEQVEGRGCKITVELEADSRDATKSWPRVKWVNPASAPRSRPAEGDLLSRLSAKAARIARPAPSAPPSDSKSDLPF
jgi:hypothetical protein